jgi:hypothetical protein
MKKEGLNNMSAIGWNGLDKQIAAGALKEVVDEICGMEGQVKMVSEILKTKDSIIEVLQHQLQEREEMWKRFLAEKEEITSKQVEVISSLEQTCIMFYKILYRLKEEAETPEEIKAIMNEFTIDFTTVLAIH